MTPFSRRHAAARRLGLLAGATIAVAPMAAQAESPAANLFYERALMSRAGERCGLFTPAVAVALAAARDQARGAALRAGDSPASIDAVQARALARADGADCRSAGLKTAADRVRQAFADYSRLSVMRFPGARSAWRAERPDARLKGARWSLVQATPGSGGWILFGIAGGRPALLDARRGAAPAAFARIRLRDPALLDRPFLSGPAPQSVSRTVLASGRGPAERTLWPAGATGAVLYSFPPELLTALEALDPRELAIAELVYPAAGRERVASAEIEVGDLKAARAFLSVPAAPMR